MVTRFEAGFCTLTYIVARPPGRPAAWRRCGCVAHFLPRTAHAAFSQPCANPLNGAFMTTYLVVDTLLTNPELYEQYKLVAKPIVEKHGGTYLARGGKLSVKEDQLWKPTRMVLIEFPSMEQAEGFYQSAEYQQALGISRQAARRTVFFLEGI
jgi:uncharacterized protein (DUF1330 family)